jgi:ComF family protein
MTSLAARTLALVAPPFCWSCGEDAPLGESLCAKCRRELRWLDAATVRLEGVELWAPLAYEGAARSLVRGLKYRGAAGLARPMAAQMAANAPAGLLVPPAELVPVPLHPARRRRRGFNQAERLATALSRRTHLPVNDCLRRRGRAVRQVGRDRAERMVGASGTISWAPGRRVPEVALLVDDVVTTGATLSACAGVLRGAGVAAARAIAYARTPGR